MIFDLHGWPLAPLPELVEVHGGIPERDPRRPDGWNQTETEQGESERKSAGWKKSKL